MVIPDYLALISIIPALPNTCYSCPAITLNCFAELPGALFAAVAVERLGRKPTLLISYVISGGLYLAMLLPGGSANYKVWIFMIMLLTVMVQHS